MPLPSSVHRVLIYRLGSLGDTIVALPALHQIERSFPQAERRLLTNFPVHAKAPAAAAVLGSSGLIHDYMRYTAGTRNPLELLQLAGQIRRFRPDLLVYLMELRPARLVRRDLAFLRIACGIGNIVGAAESLVSTHRQDPLTGRYEHESHRLAQLVATLGDAQPDQPASWDLRLTKDERQRAAEALAPLGTQPFIVCGPGTKMQAKDWGAENWRTLLALLSRHYPGHGLALVGAAEDADAAHLAAAEWQGPVAQLCGLLSPRQTAAVMERGRLFLGPDSGPMDLAAAVGTPAVIAFSARGLPGIWFPIGPRHQVIYHQTSCFGCELETCTVQQRRCLLSITPQQMLDACRRVLGSHS